MMQVISQRPGPGRVVATAAFTLACSALPVFLLGALAPRISADLGVDEVAIGGLVAVFFFSGAICSLPGGLITDRIGSSAALRTGVALAATTAVAIAMLANSFWILLVLFVLAGASVPLADTGGARAISTGVPLRRQGLAFGGKEASIPIASLLAGMMVPILGAQLGWRPAYALAAGLGAIVLLAVPSGLDRVGPGSNPLGSGPEIEPGSSLADATALAVSTPAAPSERTHDATARPEDESTTGRPGEPPEEDHRPSDGEQRPASDVISMSARRALVLLAVASGLAGAAGNSAPTFLVSSSVATGVSESSAGILLAGASVAGILSRLAAGITADRRGGSERRIMGGLMIVGALGLASIAVGGPAWTIVGAVLTFGGGWGWTGLAFFAAVRLLPQRPARAAGTILAGLASGGALGPLTFGALAAGPGYVVAWLSAATAMFVAGLLVFQAERIAARGEASASERHVLTSGEGGPMPVGQEGPEPRRGGQMPAGEMVIPSRIPFDGLPASSEFPQLADIASGDMVYAGRIAETMVDLVMATFDSEEGPLVAVYAFDDRKFISYDAMSEASPAYLRITVWDDELGEADIVFWAPLDEDVAVVTLFADGQPRSAVRPRARLAAFDTTALPAEAQIRLVAHDRDGAELGAVEW